MDILDVLKCPWTFGVTIFITGGYNLKCNTEIRVLPAESCDKPAPHVCYKCHASFMAKDPL